LVSTELQQITKRLVEVRSERINAETNYFQLQQLKSNSYDSLSSLPIILKNPFVSRIKELESNSELKVSELSKRYGPKHPRMIAAQSDLDAVRESLLTQMKRIAEGIKNDFSAAKSKEQSLLRALKNSKSDMLLINQTEFQLADYVRNVKVNRTLYETFFQRINETSETGTLQTANARIVDGAVISNIPVKPKKKLIVVLALIVSLMFGIALAFLLDALDSTIKNPEDVDHKLGVPLLGLLPLLGTENLKTPTKTQSPVYSFVHGENEGFKESVRTLRTSLTLASLENPVQVLLFTSTVPGEGKTTTSVNLASAYGQMDKVLLIDADMRRPTVAKQLQLPTNSPGLSNALAYPESLDESIYTIEELNIDVMPAGAIPPNPLELLSSKKFKELLVTLRGRYQKIIIDSAPMQAVSDALYLSTLTDGLVYVIKADATADKQIKSGLTRLEDSNARILGVVLNQVDVEKEGRYGSGYNGYYDSYSYGRDV
ncbi:MAG: polysaccharide biosynthesis tyrosine autokinase, partial [Oleispira sp.]|nr:polysaccharide biosynthesis tyrosine autokinase [Oleispira sp.]